MLAFLRIFLLLSLLIISDVFCYDRLIFLHIPKCGGTSIYYMLKLNFPEKDFYPHRKLDHNGYVYLQYDPVALKIFPQINAKVTAGHFPFWFLQGNDPNIDSSFIFTIIRDPIERIISKYRDDLRLGKQICSWCPAESHGNNTECNMMCKMLSSNKNLEGEELLFDCIDTLKRIDYIILFDDFEDKIKKLFNLLNLRCDDVLWMNRTTKTSVDVIVLNDEKIQKIREANYLDVRLYEYVKNHIIENRLVE